MARKELSVFSQDGAGGARQDHGAGREGGVVPLISSIQPRNRAFLKELAGELKRVCGSGGKAGETHIEIQGDHRDKLREVLRGKGWVVKG